MDKSISYFEQASCGGSAPGGPPPPSSTTSRSTTTASPTDLRELAAISVPEPTQLLVKPFDPGVRTDIVKALETADLGLNPQVDGSTIRINVPSPSMERRRQLVDQVRKMAEEARVTIRNERRDANKHVDQLVKDKASTLSEDQGHDARDRIEDMTKKHTARIDENCEKKVEEVEEVWKERHEGTNRRAGSPAGTFAARQRADVTGAS